MNLLALLLSLAFAAPVSVGSKKFTESVILGEIARTTLIQAGVDARHVSELGGTRLLWNALKSGDIDAYVEYRGTLSEEILRAPVEGLEDLRRRLEPHGLGALAPLGFNNTYALAMKRERAEALGVRKISDLVQHQELRFGMSGEFLRRRDGWPGLSARYDLKPSFVRALDHDIAYRALESGDIDVTDSYSTDAEISYHDLVVLEDDRAYFPNYEAFVLYRLDLKPEAVEALASLSGTITDDTMVRLNRAAKIDRISPEEIAHRHLGAEQVTSAPDRAARIWRRTQEHASLVLLSLAFAILIGVPLGIQAERNPRVGSMLLWLVGVVQTIPALALLVVLIRPLNFLGLRGIGDTPALIALFLYGLLPIVRATHTGFRQVPRSLLESAELIGLSHHMRLWRVELPLARPMILAGVKTAAVMGVGFATLGALVGAGGYGQPILTGVRLDDYGLILEGAVPAAVMALLVQRLFDLWD